MYTPGKFRGEQLHTLWKPFTANKAFHQNPKIFHRAEGMYYYTDEGHKILDGASGLWCCNLGHCHPKVVEAIRQAAGRIDYSPAFQVGNDLEYALSLALKKIMPVSVDHVLFTNSGSESVDTAIKIALAYHRLRGEGTRTRLIGRERGYHGVGFGGMSVGGIVNNRRFFGNLLTGVDHIRHTLLPQNAFSRGLPQQGAELADDLLDLIALHGAENIAAVVVEPIACSGGVILPPVGYLQRLQKHCQDNGILLIFDEVITAYGRTGTPFAATTFDVQPDIVATAKGLTSGTVPMGAVFVSEQIYQTFMQKSPMPIELFHGYTYSGHPLASAAALAAQQVYQEEKLFIRAAEMATYFEQAVHSLQGLAHVQDIRNYGLVAGIELQAEAGKPGRRAMEVFDKAYAKGVMVRANGDNLTLSPPLIVERGHIDTIIEVLSEAIQNVK